MILDLLLDHCDSRAEVHDVRIGRHWTAVAVRRAQDIQAGLASALSGPEDHPHHRPPVHNAGRLSERSAADLTQMIRSDSVAEASVGLATVNALLHVDVPACVEVNAGQVLVDKGADKRVAIVGHFPFIPRVHNAARQLWVLELRPREGDLPADQASEMLPQADVVGITGSTLVNHTFDGLIALCRPEAFVMVMGGSTPLSPLFFDLGVDAVAGTLVVDAAEALRAVSEGATFRQIGGKRLLTLFK
jgi:uncharacterized protein (DUF4213/DUF364 family)